MREDGAWISSSSMPVQKQLTVPDATKATQVVYRYSAHDPCNGHMSACVRNPTLLIERQPDTTVLVRWVCAKRESCDSSTAEEPPSRSYIPFPTSTRERRTRSLSLSLPPFYAFLHVPVTCASPFLPLKNNIFRVRHCIPVFEMNAREIYSPPGACPLSSSSSSSS